MKRVIEGLLYDTDKAEWIGDGSSNCGGSNFGSYLESLYRTKSGRFFLEGHGGPMTRWGVSEGNSTTGSSGIIALNESEALEWCEDHDVDAEVIAAHFTVKEA